MKDDELKEIWKSSTEIEFNQMDKSSMINIVQSDIKNWDKMLRNNKTTRGVLVTILIGWTIIFGMIAYTSSDTQSKIGVILCLLFFGYIMIRIIWSKNLHQRNFSETYLDYLYKIKKHLRGYKKLYDVILYIFYPLAATGSLLFRMNTFTSIGVVIIELLIVIGLGIVFFFFYKWALKLFILQRLEKVDKLIEALKD